MDLVKEIEMEPRSCRVCGGYFRTMVGSSQRHCHMGCLLARPKVPGEKRKHWTYVNRAKPSVKINRDKDK